MKTKGGFSIIKPELNNIAHDLSLFRVSKLTSSVQVPSIYSKLAKM